MHDFLFAESAMPLQRSSLRLPLRTYSIGHELLLWRTQNPLMILSREQFEKLPALDRKVALRRAVLICHNDWERNQRKERNLWLWFWLTERRCAWALEEAEFRNYLEEGRKLFATLSASNRNQADAYEIANKGDELKQGRSLGAPFLAALIGFAAEKKLWECGFANDGATWSKKQSTHRIYDLPFSFCGNLMLADWESDGRVYIENFREMEERLNLEKLNEEIEERKAQCKMAWANAQTNEDKEMIVKAYENVIRFFPEITKWVLEKAKCHAENLKRFDMV